MQPTTALSRLLALDYLRGFFIVVIIIDHLWRWPNLFEYVSGRGELWASAAEGFVIISGLLIGYIRGYKNRHQPFTEVSKKLIKRGVLLYIWMYITTAVLVALSWYLSYKGSLAYIPYNEYDWQSLLLGMLRLDYVHSLTHFLYLYAIFLVISPIVIILLRRSLAWIVAVLSLIVWFAGTQLSIEWMQWQILFFLPSIAGYYLEPLRHRYNSLPQYTRTLLAYGSICITAITIIFAASIILPSAPGTYSETLFTREPLSLARILIAFVWFIGLFSLFELSQRFIQRYFGWLLLPFGTKSLTAYILHTLPLMAFSFFFASFDTVWMNTLAAVACILATWALIKIPNINRVIPR
jgi:hypothetical protein